MDDFKSPVWLCGTQVMERNRPSHEICELETGGIGRFRDHDQAERKWFVERIGAIAYAPECQFKLGILPLTPFLYDDGSFRRSLPLPFEKAEHTLKSRFEGVVVWVDWFMIARGIAGLVDHHCYYCGGQRLHLCRHPCKKPLANLLLDQKQEIAERFPDFMFMKNHFVMPPELEFELLESRADLIHIQVLANDCEEENENRELGIDFGEIVIAAFVNEYEIITECACIRHGSGGGVEGFFEFANGFVVICLPAEHSGNFEWPADLAERLLFQDISVFEIELDGIRILIEQCL